MTCTKRVALFLFMIILAGLPGCKKENLCDCIKSTGSDVREDRDATPFNDIQLEGKIDLVLTQDSTEHISVVAGSHLIKNIETSISGGKLYIRNHNKCNFVRSYDRRITVFVSVHHLHNLFYNGAGDVTSANTLKDSLISVNSTDGSGSMTLAANCQVLNVTLTSGPADIHISGSSQLMYIYSGGNGTIQTNQIACPQVYLSNLGTGDLQITATSTLNATLNNTGNVYCMGHPTTVIRKETGTGRLILQ